MNKYLCSLFVVLALAVWTTTAFASANPIYDALMTDGVKAEQMSDANMAQVRGTGFVYGLVDPSCTTGVREYQITYKQFGAMSDYRSYNFIGYGENTGAYYDLGVGPNGIAAGGFGDVWLADTKSAPNAWNRNNAQPIEYHLKTFDKISDTSGRFNGYGFTNTAWNRPLSTFRW